MIKTITVLFFVILILQSCSSVKEYEKEKINDPDMKLTARTAERYETSFQVYREAAAGANGGKSGGGCGCN
jgi:PBP1b-binding outer membrane lipoprotein LpoB